MNKAENFGLCTKVVLQNDFVSVCYSRDHSLLILYWKRQIDFEERKQAFMWGYDFSKEHQVKNWLIDDEEIYMISQQEREWIENSWTELASQANIGKIAVYTPDHFNTLSTMTDFTSNAQKNYKHHGITEHEVFTDYQMALHWLKANNQQ